MPYVIYNAKRGLIATNLALRSHEFDNATWTKTNVTVTADNTTAPDGSSNMDRIVETAVNAVHSVSQSSASLDDNTVYTASVYAKQGQRTWIAILITKKDGTVGSAYFNLATGAVGTTSGVTASIVASSNGAYRCIAYCDVLTGATTPSVEVRLATGDGTSSYLGVTTDGAFLWGFQLVEGSSALEYDPTQTATAHASGSSYTIGFDAEQLDPSFSTKRTQRVSLGGSTETIFQRTEEKWAVKTSILEESDIPQWRELLKSVAGGETFTFDPYGTTSVGADGLRTTTADDAKSVIMDSDSWSEERESSTRMYRVSFTVKVV